MKLKKIENVVEEMEPLPQLSSQANINNPLNKKEEGKSYYRQKKSYTDLRIDDLVDTLFNVKFTGEIFKVDERETKTGILIQTIYVKDDNNAVVVKVVGKVAKVNILEDTILTEDMLILE